MFIRQCCSQHHSTKVYLYPKKRPQMNYSHYYYRATIRLSQWNNSPCTRYVYDGLHCVHANEIVCVCVCTSTFHLFFLIPFRNSYIKCIWLNKMVIFPSRYVQHKSINVNYIQTIYHCVPNSYAHSAVNNAILLYARIRYTRDVDSYCRQLSKINQQHQRQRPQHQRRRWRRRQ